jgi:hypothetical protein
MLTAEARRTKRREMDVRHRGLEGRFLETKSLPTPYLCGESRFSSLVAAMPRQAEALFESNEHLELTDALGYNLPQ